MTILTYLSSLIVMTILTYLISLIVLYQEVALTILTYLSCLIASLVSGSSDDKLNLFK